MFLQPSHHPFFLFVYGCFDGMKYEVTILQKSMFVQWKLNLEDVILFGETCAEMFSEA